MFLKNCNHFLPEAHWYQGYSQWFIKVQLDYNQYTSAHYNNFFLSRTVKYWFLFSSKFWLKMHEIPMIWKFIWTAQKKNKIDLAFSVLTFIWRTWWEYSNTNSHPKELCFIEFDWGAFNFVWNIRSNRLKPK